MPLDRPPILDAQIAPLAGRLALVVAIAHPERQACTDPCTTRITHALAHTLTRHPGPPLVRLPGGAPRSRGISLGPWPGATVPSPRDAPRSPPLPRTKSPPGLGGPGWSGTRPESTQ